MSETSSHSVRIEPLKGSENYFSWCVQEEDILTEMDLLEYAKGETTIPTEPATAVTAWKKKDRKALSAIRLRCSSEVAVHIATCETSKDAWDTLKSLYAAQGVMAKITLSKRLQKYEMEEGANIEEEIRKMTKMRQELTMSGGTVPDDEFAFNILSALPESWGPFVQAQKNVTKSSVVIGDILSEHMRREEKTGTTTALAARNGRFSAQKPRKSKFLKGVYCHGCGKEGHLRNVCRSSNQGSGSGSNTHHANAAEAADVETDNESYSFAATATTLSFATGNEVWLGDTASDKHIVRDRAAFTTFTELSGHTVVGAGVCAAPGQGTVRVEFDTPEGRKTAMLNDCLWAPDMSHNLLALGRCTAAGMTFVGEGTTLHVKRGARTVAVGHRLRAGKYLYRMDMRAVPPSPTSPTSASTFALAAQPSKRTWYEWHCALGHINTTQLQEMHRQGLVDGMTVDTSSDPDFECDACVQAKHARAPFPEIATGSADQIGAIIYSDIWGPARVTSLQGNSYVITFTDAKSRFVGVDFMKSRDAALDRFKKHEQLIERQTGHKVKIVHVDNAKEYTAGQFRQYAESRGIVIRTTAPYSPAQNGVAERLNRTLAERARAMLIARSLPKFLWQEAWAYACFLKNRTPTRALKGTTPHEAFWGSKPNVQDAHEFGEPCWVLVPENRRDKLSAKSEQYTFTGVGGASAGWRYFVPGLRQVLVSRDVIFRRTPEPPSVPFTLEGESDSAPAQSPAPDTETASPPSRATTPGTPSRSNAPSPFKAEGTSFSTPPSLRAALLDRNVTTRRPRLRLDYNTLHNTGERVLKKAESSDEEFFDPASDHSRSAQAHVCYAAIDYDHPRTLDEVRGRDDWPQWKEAMDAEMSQLQELHTYEKTTLPEGRKAIGCRWVFAIKRDSEGNIAKYKARLVAQGFSQIPGQDYFDTYAPVVRLESFRLCAAIAADFDLDDDTIDYTGAYLNATLEEPIYMRQPPGYEDNSGSTLVLRKAIYGLKQAGRAWNELLNHVLTNLLGYTRSTADPCVYFKRSDSLTLALLHVDDTTLYGKRPALEELKADIAHHFAITQTGALKNFVGIQVDRDRTRRTITIHQNRYITVILERFGMLDCNPVATPLDPNVKLIPLTEDEAPIEAPYAAAIGSLMYAAIGTRPDISFAVQTLSQFTSRPSATHWTAVKHVFRYLKGTQTLGITYGASRGLDPTGYSDADWAQSLSDRRSISGYAFRLGNGVISWSSKKQATVALSTMEAEYIALSHAAKEAVWLRHLLGELGVITDSPTILFTDNQASIAYAHDNQFHARSKHIDIRHHFIRERIKSGDIKVVHCASEDNVADMFTKALSKPKHSAALSLANMTAR
ncbi:polyprotein [Phanerochaete sordida]|uniref:Polyprotein n=1 Tax=Phanerochaete sordida TaxID=48140 RepID=A0A9P3GU38_9APHY|nr:polyprotein [Phanerochaete sordida]